MPGRGFPRLQESPEMVCQAVSLGEKSSLAFQNVIPLVLSQLSFWPLNWPNVTLQLGSVNVWID